MDTATANQQAAAAGHVGVPVLWKLVKGHNNRSVVHARGDYPRSTQCGHYYHHTESIVQAEGTASEIACRKCQKALQQAWPEITVWPRQTVQCVNCGQDITYEPANDKGFAGGWIGNDGWGTICGVNGFISHRAIKE